MQYSAILIYEISDWDYSLIPPRRHFERGLKSFHSISLANLFLENVYKLTHSPVPIRAKMKYTMKSSSTHVPAVVAQNSCLTKAKKKVKTLLKVYYKNWKGYRVSVMWLFHGNKPRRSRSLKQFNKRRKSQDQHFVKTFLARVLHKSSRLGCLTEARSQIRRNSQ